MTTDEKREAISCDGDCKDCENSDYCIVHKSDLKIKIELVECDIKALGNDYSYLYTQIIGVKSGEIKVNPACFADDLIEYWTLERSKIKARLNKLEKELKRLKQLEKIGE